MVEEERTAGDGIERPLVEEEAARGRRDVDGARVAEGDEAAQAGGAGQIEAQIPALEVAVREGEREDDAGVLELVLIAGEARLALPEIKVHADARADALLDAEVVGVLPFGVDEELAARSEEHTSELQSRGLISYAVF